MQCLPRSSVRRNRGPHARPLALCAAQLFSGGGGGGGGEGAGTTQGVGRTPWGRLPACPPSPPVEAWGAPERTRALGDRLGQARCSWSRTHGQDRGGAAGSAQGPGRTAPSTARSPADPRDASTRCGGRRRASTMDAGSRRPVAGLRGPPSSGRGSRAPESPPRGDAGRFPGAHAEPRPRLRASGRAVRRRARASAEAVRSRRRCGRAPTPWDVNTRAQAQWGWEGAAQAHWRRTRWAGCGRRCDGCPQVSDQRSPRPLSEPGLLTPLGGGAPPGRLRRCHVSAAAAAGAASGLHLGDAEPRPELRRKQKLAAALVLEGEGPGRGRGVPGSPTRSRLWGRSSAGQELGLCAAVSGSGRPHLASGQSAGSLRPRPGGRRGSCARLSRRPCPCREGPCSGRGNELAAADRGPGAVVSGHKPPSPCLP